MVRTNHQRCSRVLGALLAAAVLSAMPVRSVEIVRTAQGNPVYWIIDEIHLEPRVPPAAATDITAEDLQLALVEAAERWTMALRDCRTPLVVILPLQAGEGPSRQDAVNRVQVATRRCETDAARERPGCFSGSQAAITHLYPRNVPGNPVDGQILEADIVIDGTRHRYSLHGEVQGTRSLSALLVHELGHLLGLDHASEADSSAMVPDPVAPHRSEALVPSAADVAILCEHYGRDRVQL